MSGKFVPYEEGKKDIRSYRITRTGGTYHREELVDGLPRYVMYGGPGTGGIPVVRLTPDGARQLAHLKLVETSTKPSEIKSDDDEGEKLVVPDDWETLPAGNIKVLAGKISGDDVTSVKKAKAIIREYVSGEVEDNDDSGSDDE